MFEVLSALRCGSEKKSNHIWGKVHLLLLVFDSKFKASHRRNFAAKLETE
jgi:hypothetical protein